MPYIKQKDRMKYTSILNELNTIQQIETKGDLEFLIASLQKKFMSTREQRYSTLHDCVYATQHCADEFRRRFLDKREIQALMDNGDI